MFEKVLVCLDGSTLAEAILPYIAAESGVIKKVVLLQVLAPPGVSLPIGVPGEAMPPVQTSGQLKHLREEMDEAPAYLEGEAQRLRLKGLDVECVVLQGKPTREIVDYAQNNDISLIAIATHGLTGLREIALGSTAEYVLKNSGLPILMVTPWKKH